MKTIIKVRDAEQMAQVLAAISGAWVGKNPAITACVINALLAMGVSS